MTCLKFEDGENLKWAIGKTGRTTFVWTIAPPGTNFTDCFSPEEDYYLSIFKWADPFWSALDIKIDEDFIFFLRDGHNRKEFNLNFQGMDYNYTRAPGNIPQRPLPLGNHVISVCMAAGILNEKPKRRFSLRADWLSKSTWKQINAVAEELQKYLDEVKVTRRQIMTDDNYLKNQKMADRYADYELKKWAAIIWDKANVSKMDDIPPNEIARNLIRAQLIGEVPHFYDNSGRLLTPEEVEEEAQYIVREAWKNVRKNISNRVQVKLKQYAEAGHEAPKDKDAERKLVLKARREVLRELTADQKNNDSK